MRTSAIVAGVVALLALAPSAAAHAYLETATPGPDGVQSKPPRSLRLVFDVGVVPRYARVEVVTPRGRNLAGAPRVSGNVVLVPLRRGQKGSYTVRWRMVATADGHATLGAFSFGVQAKPLQPSPARGVGIPVAPELLAWLQFLGVVLAGGMLTVRALVGAPARRILGESGVSDGPAAIGAGVIGAVLGLHAGVLGFLAGAYPIIGGGLLDFANTAIEPIRTGTHLGQAWTITTFAWFGVLMLLIGAWVTPDKRERLLACAGVLSFAIAFGISWGSHPAARGTVALLTDYLHLLAGAVWVGGLVALAILLRAARPLSRQARDAIVGASALRFSALAVPTVIAVALAGAYLALRQLPTPAALLSSGYGITLLVKSFVVLGALGLGAYHRRLVVPRVSRGASIASLRRPLTLELGFLLVALALAATLGQTAPPR